MNGVISIFNAFLLLNFILGKVLSQNPEITERILPDIQRMGVTGQLRCVVINQQNNPVHWIQRSTSITISADDAIVIDDVHNVVVNGWPKYQVERTTDGEKAIYTLIIHRLEPIDAGNYTCQILVRGSTVHPAKDGEMVVLIPPSIIQGQTTHTLSVIVNDPLNITCEATGYPRPNITWIRVNGDILPNGALKHRGTVMTFDPVRIEDRGVYRCLADNNVRPPASYDLILLVFFPPVARALQDSYGQAENRQYDITIECRISGFPEPDLKWFQALQGGGRQAISNDDKHTINILLNHANVLNTNERWFQLVIRTVQANDYGDYYCQGSNNLGIGEATITVFATSECQGANCPEEGGFVSQSVRNLQSSIKLLVTVMIMLHFSIRRPLSL